MEELRNLMRFIRSTPTAFHAAANVRTALLEAGYEPLEEGDPWDLKPGGRYCLTRNLSSIVALRIPERGFSHFQIVATHADSPCFKLKPDCVRTGGGYVTLNVEKYGGMLMSSWMDRPLGIAGRTICRVGNRLEARMVILPGLPALIPNLPIHFNRNVNDGVALNAQVDMLPVLAADGDSHTLSRLIADAAGCSEDCILGADLYLFNPEEPVLWGANGEFIASPRLDDLECAFASLQALLGARDSNHIDVLALFDNEEVGSGTRQGADSTLLSDALRRVALSLGARDQDLEAALARSFLISADNAHAVHPNHPEKYDEDNRVRMNGGVVVKFHAAQKYASDAESVAVFEEICRCAGVPVQRFANRSDIPGGSTLGNLSTRHVSVRTVDIGLAQLAMHSSMESAGAQDFAHMVNALRAFHEAEIGVARDGRISIAL